MTRADAGYQVPARFAERLIDWQRKFGRRSLPWQVADPYAVWVSEIMLQQTQVDTVFPYYARFMARFPNLSSLASATEDEVLAHWSGLGYYARARYLQAAARKIMQHMAGRFPERFEDLLALPGIGRSTAGAIAAFAYGERRAILDGNVKRVYCRLFGIEGWPGEKAVEHRLWQLAESVLPERDLGEFTQGLMDLGALLCKRSRPNCAACPFTTDCVAHRQGRQHALPSARPRKAMPEKTTVMLVIRRAAEVLLEKRPLQGIWGGLWSLPECADPPGIDSAIRALDLIPDEIRALPSLAHTFSHFRLVIYPMLCSVQTGTPRLMEPGRLWLTPADALHAALPTPVRKIILAAR